MTRAKETLRMCIACRQMINKNDLIRVVKTPEQEIVLDFTGKKNGRGAYICNSEACINKCIKAKLISRAFKQEIAPEVYENIKKEFSIGTKQ